MFKYMQYILDLSQHRLSTADPANIHASELQVLYISKKIELNSVIHQQSIYVYFLLQITSPTGLQVISTPTKTLCIYTYIYKYTHKVQTHFFKLKIVWYYCTKWKA
jgi:hypothetical protein